MQNPPKSPKEKKTAAANNVDVVIYDRFVEVNSIALSFEDSSETKISPELEKELEKLQRKMKSFSGKIARRTCTAAINSETCKMVKGFPVKKEIEELVKLEGSEGYYFG